MKSLENQEKSIFLLEQLDNNIAQIKQELKVLRKNIRKIHLFNKNISENCAHWINIFINSDNKADSKIKSQTSDSQNPISCDDLFADGFCSGNIGNNNFLSQIENSQNKANFSLLEEFSDANTELSNVPEAFQNENELIKLFEFIKINKKVSLKNLFEQFENTSPEKLEIFINFLVRRRYVYIDENLIHFRKKEQ